MTDRSIAAAVTSSPFSNHEPFQAPKEPTVLNFPPYQRQLFRAVFESFTQEEVTLLFKLIRVVSTIFSDVDLEKIHGEASAYKQGWEKMRKYRETGQ